MRLGLREANQHFARTIKAVRAGQEVVLTDRGRPIAVIKPIKDDEGDREAVLQTMAEEGLITVADREGPMPTPRWRPVKVKGAPVSKTIIDEREDTA
jgi:prevent-host-death family protein